MKYDTTLKKVFRIPPNRLLSLALGREVVIKQVLSADLIRVENMHPDLLFETEDGELIHAEVHGYGMAEFPVRNLVYFAGLLRDFGRPPQQIVFWIGPGKVGVAGGLSFPPALEYKYRVIDVREIDGEHLIEGGAPEESIFAVLCKLRNPSEAVAGILRRIAEMPVQQQREAVVMLLVLSGLRGLNALVKDEVKRMAVSFDIHENEFLEEIYQEGVEKGVEKGRQEAARNLLIDLTEQKFGSLPADVRQRIDSAAMADVHRWSRCLLHSSTVDEIFR